MIKYDVLKVTDLKPFPIREIRQNVIEQLNERIKERGYNQAKPLTVVKTDDGFFVADGNHRLKVLQDNNIDSVPCVIYTADADIYNLAVQANVDEDTYAPMDLFDWIECISLLAEFTQEEIAIKLNWDRGKVNHYKRALNIDTNILNLCKEKQSGRVSKNDTTVTFNFTERWFRDSGLYDLKPKYQLKLIESFIKDKFNWNKSKVQSESAKYKTWQEMQVIAENKLMNAEDLPKIIELIENNTFKRIDQLQNKINDLNKQASNKLICGDALIELEKLEDGSIDLVITDPPYGIEYISNHSKYNEYVTKNEIANDGLDEALTLIDKTCEILNRKTKKDSHIYIFTSWRYSDEFKRIISKYFDVKNCIIWDKGNSSMGDLDGTWGNAYEIIIFATKGNKKLNIRKQDVININRVSTVKAIHPTQKPEALINELLIVSAQPADTVIDPFMGSGSTIKAVKEYGNINYIGIELDSERFEKAKAYIGGNG